MSQRESAPGGCAGRAFGIVLALGLAAGLGCARTRYYEYESVTPDREGTLWVAGSEGRLAHWDGKRWLERGYPLDPRAPDWSYEPAWSSEGSLPARVAIIAGAPYLFTRPGDVLRWDGSTWRPGWVRFAPESSWEERAQVNAVVNLPGGEVMVALHSQRLLRGTPAAFEQGHAVEETAPTYFTWFGVLGSTLHGIGWDGSGNVRALYRYRAAGDWELVGTMGAESVAGEPRCAVAGADGQTWVVASRAIVAFGSDAPLPKTVVPVVRAPLDAGRRFDDSGTAPSIARCFPADDGATALLVLAGGSSAGDANILVVHGGSVAPFRCDGVNPYEVIGAVRDDATGAPAAERGFRLVAKNPELADAASGAGPALALTSLPGPSCHALVAAPPLHIAE